MDGKSIVLGRASRWLHARDHWRHGAVFWSEWRHTGTILGFDVTSERQE